MQSVISTNYMKSSGLLTDSFVAIFAMLHLHRVKPMCPQMNQDGLLYKVQTILKSLQNFKMCILQDFLQFKTSYVHFCDTYNFKYIWKPHKYGKCMLDTTPVIKTTIAHSVLYAESVSTQKISLLHQVWRAKLMSSPSLHSLFKVAEPLMFVRYISLFLSTRTSCRSPGDPAWFKAISTTPPPCLIGGASTNDRAVPSSNKCTTETE